MGWSGKYKKSIDCNNPRGFSQRAHCAARKKRQKGENTLSKSPFNEQMKPYKTPEQIAKKHRLEVSFIEKQLKIGEPIEHEHTKDHKLAMEIALQHLDEIPDYYTRLLKMEKDAKKEHRKKFKDVNEDLRNWFNPSHPDGGWKRYNTKGEAIGSCAREEGESKPKCLSNKKASQLRSQGGAKAIASAVRRKRKADPVANRKGKGGKPKMVSNNIGEQSEMIRYCPKCQKNETQSECKYGPSFWAMYSTPSMLTTNQMKFDIAQVHPANEEKDHEYSMARSELATIINAAKRLKKKMKGEGNIEAWVQSKITKAADYIDTAADYLESGEHKVDEACWTGYKQVGMKKKGKRNVPNCVPEEVSIEEENKPTNPKLWAKWKAKAKAKFDVYPSAYANGWAAKGYKSEGGGWESVSEGTFGVGVGFDISPGHRGAQKTQKIYNKAIKGAGTEKEWLKKTGPQLPAGLPLAKKKSEMQTAGYEPEGQILDEKHKKGHKKYKKTTEPRWQDSDGDGKWYEPGEDVKKEGFSNWRSELGEDWQKVNRKDKTDGLSQKAVDAYRRENPGSKLQTAVTEKKPTGKRAQRRKNFCSRMSGMKKRLTSAKTARDPDSRINKALRRWRCN